jgi:hypothetical protein
LIIDKLNISKMDTKVTKAVQANLPAKRKEFAVKAQMPEVLRGSLTKR